MKSTHPYPPFIPKGATKLIIGTIPPPRFCKEKIDLYDDDVNFYYGSRDNSFWSILEEIFEEKLIYKNISEAVEQRKTFLEKNRIGITDIVAECIHDNDSANDKDLKDIKRKDIGVLLTDNPEINTLIYTSEFVKKQINEHFNNTYHSIDQTNKKKQTVRINGKLYQVRILYSPSPLALINMGKDGTFKRKEQYKEFLTEDL